MQARKTIFYYGVYPSNTPTQTASTTATPSITPTITSTSSVTPSNTPSITISVTSTPTNTVTPSITISNTSSSSITPTPTVTPTITPTTTSTPTNTPTITSSITPFVTVTPSRTETPAITPTPTETPLVTPSITPSNTQSISISPTITPSITISSTITPTPSITPTTTVTVTPSLTPSSSIKIYSNYEFYFDSGGLLNVTFYNGTSCSTQTINTSGSPLSLYNNYVVGDGTIYSTNGIFFRTAGVYSNCGAPPATPSITPTITPTMTKTPSVTPSIAPSVSVSPSSGSTSYYYYLPNCTQDALEDVYYRGIVNGVFVKCMAPGDTIVFPAGSATWGASSRPNGGKTWITHPINITGQGDSTVITIDESGPVYTQGVLNIWSTVTVSNMKFIGAQTRPVTPFTTNPYNNSNGQAGGCATGGINYTGGGRITNVTYESRGGAGYFLYGGNVESFLIDNCRFSATAGNTELIFARGPTNAWNLDTTLGGPNNIFVEDCTFAGAGYVNDGNSNSRMVVRNCTITGPIKVDGHGVASNTPAESVRNMEVYNNRWTYTSPFWVAIEARGGVNMIFNNQSAVNNGRFFLTDYGYLAQWPNFGNVYQTPINYPIKGQIGVSKNPRVAGGEPSYVWGNRVGSAVWDRTYKTVPAAAISLYQTQVGSVTATFSETTMIKANRDFFAEGGFDTIDTTPGVSIGTKAALLSTTPAFSGYGFWVTDEGTWNKSLSGGQGRLYKWNGSAWNLYYEPYTYPHPLRG